MDQARASYPHPTAMIGIACHAELPDYIGPMQLWGQLAPVPSATAAPTP